MARTAASVRSGSARMALRTEYSSRPMRSSLLAAVARRGRSAVAAAVAPSCATNVRRFMRQLYAPAARIQAPVERWKLEHHAQRDGDVDGLCSTPQAKTT